MYAGDEPIVVATVTVVFADAGEGGAQNPDGFDPLPDPDEDSGGIPGGTLGG